MLLSPLIFKFYFSRWGAAILQYLENPGAVIMIWWSFYERNSPANTNTNTNNTNAQRTIDTTFSDRNEASTHAGRINETVEITQEITHFADDNPVIDEKVPQDSNLQPHFINEHHDNRTHSVISFLQRPQLVSSFVWSPGAARGTILQRIRIPDNLFTSMIADKVDGFGTFRADTIFRLQVNSQPFQCGRLVMSYIPVPELLGSRYDECTRAMDRLIALPHVQLDIAEQSEVTLRVPYVSPYSAYNLIEGRYSWGELVLSVYSPLNQVSQPSLRVNVFGNFDNITLGFPTMSTSLLLPSNVAIEQVKLNSVTDVIRKGENNGPRTWAVGAASIVAQKASDALGDWIPATKKFTEPIAKGLDAAYDVLSSFVPGFSKPDTNSNPMPVLARPAQYFSNVDGEDGSQKLSLFHVNEVDMIPDFAGSKIDEMSFDYVKRIPNFISAFNFSNSNTFGDILWTTLVTPTYFSQPYTFTATGQSGFSTQTPTSLSYALSPFALWRGGLVYTFRAVKTEFHSGRIEFAFSPFTSRADYYDNHTTRSEYVYKIIMDLRKQSEVSFVVPFVSTTNYKQLKSEKDPLTASDDTAETLTYATGILGVRALTPLVMGSAIVSNTIEFVVEIKGALDFEAECPISSDWIPLTPVSSGSGVDEQGSTATVVVEQAAFASTGQRDVRSDYLEDKLEIKDITGNNSNHKLDGSKAAACIGEGFGNYRYFIKRFGWYYSFANQPYTERMPLRAPGFSLSPSSGGGTHVSVNRSFNPLIYTSQMYAFFRGGFRYKHHHKNNDYAGQLAQASLGLTFQRTSNSLPLTLQPVNFELKTKGLWEFGLPFYSPTVVNCVYSTVATDELSHFIGSPTFFTDDSPNFLASAAADDFDLGFYLGAPLAVNWRVLANASHLSPSTTNNGFNSSEFKVAPYNEN